MTIKSIQFYNSTIYPILVDGWGRHSLDTIIVHPNEECKIFSETGEWFIHKMFCSDNKEAQEFWQKMGLGSFGPCLGKFRSEPCASGDYSWMDYHIFDAIYDDGLIIFTEK
jgi:hypothetical protein